MQAMLVAAWLATGAQAQTAPMQPAYQAVERVSDGVYKVLRTYVAGTLLPDRLTRHMSATPEDHTYGLFTASLAENQSQAAAELRGAYPKADIHGLRKPAELSEWQRRFEREEVQVGLDSLKDALVDRYGLEDFGRFSNDYAKDRRNWDAQFVASSAVLGGAYAYFAGARMTFHAGPFRARVKARGVSRSAALELGTKDGPLTLVGEVGRYATRYGVSFAQRF